MARDTARAVPSRNAPPRPLPLDQSKSTPNLPTLASLQDHSPSPRAPAAAPPGENAGLTSPQPSLGNVTSPSELASIEDFSLDASTDAPSLASLGTSDDGEEEEARLEGARSHSVKGDDDDDDDDDEEEEEDEHHNGEEDQGPVSKLPGRLLSNHQHSRSHTYLGPSAFAPPFYNRPPTPLPPSPSLTSLLRPNFSSQNSRPTTPDPSSDEGPAPGGGTQTPASAAASTLTSTLRSSSAARPVPRASPKVPTYEYYGFTLYLTSSVAFIVYLLWAFLPSPFLHQLGISYYPNRWWALAIPAWTVMLVVYIYVALAAYNVGYLTLPLHSVECLVDDAANIAVVDAEGKLVRDERPSWRSASPEGAARKSTGAGGGGGGRRALGAGKGRHSRQGSLTRMQQQQQQQQQQEHRPARKLDWRRLWNEGTDAVMDIPVGGVCEILYGAMEAEDAEEGDER